MDLSGKINKYLVDQLQNLNNINEIRISQEDLPGFIYKNLTTSKYRRHSISKEYQDHIKNVINVSIKDNKPIPLVWVFGCYKLWRLKESPYADWAELFFLIHKINWLKPILSVYKPGVWFDFFADGIVVPVMNNITKKEMDEYQKSFVDILLFIKRHTPNNLQFTLHTLEDLYGKESEFQKEFKVNYKKIIDQDKISRLVLSEQQANIIKMNVKSERDLTVDDLHKSQLIFEAFLLSSKRRPYYRTPEKIFLDSFPIKNTLPIGVTRASTVRFWVGVGVLRKYKDSFIEDILSVNQLQQTNLSNYKVTIDGLNGHNFKSINLIQS